MSLGTVTTVQNLNKRVEKKKKRTHETKTLLQLQYCTVKYVGCTVPKHCSSIATFYILRNMATWPQRERERIEFKLYPLT